MLQTKKKRLASDPTPVVEAFFASTSELTIHSTEVMYTNGFKNNKSRKEY